MTELARIHPTDPEVFTPLPARPDTDSWIAVVTEVSKLATYIAPTDFVPKSLRDSAPAVAAAILYGREVGLAPMTALTQTHVIEGKPAISAEAMRAMILAAGHQLLVTETTGAICTMKARRRGEQEWTALTWNLDMARAAGILNKQVWKSYPRQMLQARCTTELARLVFPDVIHGFRTVEELEDLATGPGEPTDALSSTTVQRQSGKTPRRAAAAPPNRAAAAAPPTPTGPTGPPLPGEPGYDQPTPTQPEPEPEPDPAGQLSTSQSRMLFAQFHGLGIEDRSERLRISSWVTGRPLSSSNDLTAGEAATLIDTLARVHTAEELRLLQAGTPGAAGTASQGPRGRPGAPPTPTAAPTPTEDPTTAPRLANRTQARLIMTQFQRLGHAGQDQLPDRLAAAQVICGLPAPIDSLGELTAAQADHLAHVLTGCRTWQEVQTDPGPDPETPGGDTP